MNLILAQALVLTLSQPLAQLEPPLDSTPPEPQARRWYGAPILIMDGLAIALAAATIVAEGHDGATSIVTGAFALALSTLGGPIVHLTERRWGMSVLSLGMRTLGLAMTGTIGAVSAPTSNDDLGGSAILGGIIGYMVGLSIASVLDTLLMAWAPQAAAVAPSVSMIRSNDQLVPALGLSARF